MTRDPRPEPVRVVAAVVRRGESYLLCRRPPGKRHAGLWEFPGGKVRPGESDLEAVRRELAEELGVRAEALGRRLSTVRDPGTLFQVEFLEVRISGDPAPLEHSALRWCTLEGALRLGLAPADERFAVERFAGAAGKGAAP